MWLYRNDRAWLDQQTALQLERPSKSAQWRVDWNKRDIKLTQAVRHWAMVFYATIPPIRVSKTLVARSTGMQTTIEKYASRLPLTVAAIAQATESVEDFQCRRLERAGEELMAFGQPLLPWEILRIAGVKPPFATSRSTNVSQNHRKLNPLRAICSELNRAPKAQGRNSNRFPVSALPVLVHAFCPV
ncbi:TnsD family Tn7-like transposition protein [Undibacterium arcticum]